VATVLVADDDGHIREVVKFSLEQAGHRVLEAADGRAAVAICRDQPVDVVVLDIVMPEQDGLEVCRRLRERSQIPILFLSSRDDGSTASSVWRSAPTTTSPSRSARASWWPA
jgi:two-component system OmpR family response regulator